MSRSPIGLVQWFEAIRWLTWKPAISTAELAEKINLRRKGTVYSMAERIRGAFASYKSDKLLAGLDSHFGRSIAPCAKCIDSGPNTTRTASMGQLE